MLEYFFLIKKRDLALLLLLLLLFYLFIGKSKFFLMDRLNFKSKN